jgi:hypothetical protein
VWTVARAEVVDSVLDAEVHAPGARAPTEAAYAFRTGS